LPDSGGLLVQVSANGELAIEGDPIRPAALKPAVQAYLEAHPQGEGIRLKADGLVDSTRVVAVMNVMRDAGVERLQLLTITTEN
ncbi:MAG TPA: biopolymer transporter ExbD, partial [Salinisphaeraceae bacterium]|nr:biopolymer transporter ExbD [Salinisphaeraceae bacterium]